MRIRLLVTIAALATLVGAAGAALAAGGTAKITPMGVDGVRVGARHSTLEARGLLGRRRAGCPLSGPGARDARLRAPLRGVAHLTRGKARRVRSIMVTGGATARGVGIGDRISDIRAAFPAAQVDHRTDDVFQVTIVRIPRDGGGRLMFAVAVDTKRITAIGVPSLEFCE
jgi:hypothetical protein